MFKFCKKHPVIFPLAFSIFFPVLSYAKNVDDTDISFSVKPFFSKSDFKYSFNSSGADGRYGNPTSVIDFTDMSLNGVSFVFDMVGESSYRLIDFSLGSGNKNDSGRMIDDDYYSSEFVGINNPTRFSRTLSNASMSKTYSLKYSGGLVSHFDTWLFDKVRYGLGIKGVYSEFSANGLTLKEDPYELYDHKEGETIYSQDTEVIKIKNYQILNSLDFGFSKLISNNVSISSDISAVYLGYMLTKDYHLKRGDLGSPSFKTSSLMYGVDVGVSASYIFNGFDFSLGVNYSIMKPYSFRKTTEVFDAEQNSLGGIPTVSHDFKQTQYSAGVSYTF